jgi:hypothetical protein
MSSKNTYHKFVQLWRVISMNWKFSLLSHHTIRDWQLRKLSWPGGGQTSCPTCPSPPLFPEKHCQPQGHECHRMAVGESRGIIIPDAFHSGWMPAQIRRSFEAPECHALEGIRSEFPLGDSIYCHSQNFFSQHTRAAHYCINRRREWMCSTHTHDRTTQHTQAFSKERPFSHVHSPSLSPATNL